MRAVQTAVMVSGDSYPRAGASRHVPMRSLGLQRIPHEPSWLFEVGRVAGNSSVQKRASKRGGKARRDKQKRQQLKNLAKMIKKNKPFSI